MRATQQGTSRRGACARATPSLLPVGSFRCPWRAPRGRERCCQAPCTRCSTARGGREARVRKPRAIERDRGNGVFRSCRRYFGYSCSHQSKKRHSRLTPCLTRALREHATIGCSRSSGIQPLHRANINTNRATPTILTHLPGYLHIPAARTKIPKNPPRKHTHTHSRPHNTTQHTTTNAS